MPATAQDFVLKMINVRERLRPLSEQVIQTLIESVQKLGLLEPIVVRHEGGMVYLVAGYHRLEACRRLGWQSIPCMLMAPDTTRDQARLAEIAENLHRSELTALERDEHITEWIRLSETVSVQLGPKVGRPESGISKAARDLGVAETSAKRAIKVAGLSDEAKGAARKTGLDRNQSAMIAAANSEDPVAYMNAEAEKRSNRKARSAKVAPDPLNAAESLEAQVASLMTAWNRAGTDARAEFLLRIDQPVMDRRFG